VQIARDADADATTCDEPMRMSLALAESQRARRADYGDELIAQIAQRMPRFTTPCH